MSSSVEQPAFKPWEMASFEGSPHSVNKASHPGITLPTIEQISGIQDQARQEGYNAGHAEGLAKGYAEGQQQAALEATRLSDLANTFTTEVGKADETISQHVLDLSVDLARALLKSALEVRPELVIPIVKEAVRYLPALHQPALLFLNPDDAVLVRERIGDELTKTGWQLTDDAQLGRGSCRVETASNQIDATLPTRWQRLAAALGKDSDWLAA
ncbi:flagellar assembly protein FliH [Thiobacillus denitrificans]|uniref:Flagellar assembly protein FliH n=1 Tax=Thiobacillus denitrificans TaxID=36861 RepID=A0A106BPD9_THIDE|nr:flagellar assembly protein FliH [Thiobacillus denitrificans]KVW96080.1 flagellar assembly protein FliH [Thiobacillus denitrificans]